LIYSTTPTSTKEIQMSELSHGNVGKREQNFTSLLPLRKKNYDPKVLAELAASMKGEPETVKDGPDPEENILVPAGYTYLGQFIDHDLTFDSTSSLSPSSSSPTNLRTPRFDLDCLYGDGPAAQPYLYDGDKLLFKNEPSTSEPTDPAGQDLLRNPLGRAIIGDKRNDENSIVSQIQLAFVKYHNAVVDELHCKPDRWSNSNSLFESARNEVRWAYQKIIVEDFLPRIIAAEVLQDLQGGDPDARKDNYLLYTEDKRNNLPREFVAAAYRFGHSGVRTGYRLNAVTEKGFNIFPSSNDPTPNGGTESLLGFDPVPNNQVIDTWGRFFPETLPGVLPLECRETAADETPNPRERLQFAYKIDTTLVDPLGVLPRAQVAGEDTAREAEALTGSLPDTVVEPPRPSLALLNLLRGNAYKIHSGQVYAQLLKDSGLDFTPIGNQHLVTRQAFKEDGETFFKFVAIPKALLDDTPLWFYILAEAQAPLVDEIQRRDQLDKFEESFLLNDPAGVSTQLRGVGGRIVAEVFYGLLDSDNESYINAAPANWQPILGGGGDIIFRNLLKYADIRNA
jgi:hypothetical protein